MKLPTRHFSSVVIKKKSTYTCRFRWPRGLRRKCAAPPLLNCRFEFRRGMAVCLLWLQRVVGWLVVSRTCRSLVQKSPTVCVYVCVCRWVWSRTTITFSNYNVRVEDIRLRKQASKKERKGVILPVLHESIWFWCWQLKTKDLSVTNEEVERSSYQLLAL